MFLPLPLSPHKPTKVVRRQSSELDPVFVGKEDLTLPFGRAIRFGADTVRLHVHRTPWTYVDRQHGRVRFRTQTAKIIRNNLHVGSMQLTQYKLPPFEKCNEFYAQMENLSREALDVAEVLCWHWKDLHFSHFGDLVVLDAVWIAPGRSAPGLLKKAVLSFCKCVREPSLFLARALPIECGYVSTAAYYQSRRRRTEALMRFLSHQFGMTPFASAVGENGWMYRFPEYVELMSNPPALVEFVPGER